MRQVLAARHDRQLHLSFGTTEIRCFQGALYIQPHRTTLSSSLQYRWHGETALRFDDLNGMLRFEQAKGQGIDPLKIRDTAVTIRLRTGGERFKPQCNRPTRSLKNLLQEAAIPPWLRNRLPLLYCEERLICVPGIGVECEFQVKSDEPGILPVWDFED